MTLRLNDISQQGTLRTDVRQGGTLGDFEIYEAHTGTTQIVLAGTSKARLREIHRQNTLADRTLLPSDSRVRIRGGFESAGVPLTVMTIAQSTKPRARAVPAERLDMESPSLWTFHGTAGYKRAIAPHPIRYYQQHPCLRNRTTLRSCFPASAEDRKRWLAVRSKLLEVGRIDGYGVYEIEYDSPVRMRSVVVGSSLDVLYEVDSCDGTDPYLTCKPAKIVLAGGTQPLIQTEFADVANHKSFLWLGPDGPHEVDFTAVVRAAQDAAPKTEADLRFRAGTYRKADGPRKVACCVGTVEVRYSIEDGIAKPLPRGGIYESSFQYFVP